LARYARGKKALAISDRSGFRIPYKNLKTEWNGLRVEPEEFEPKHPQLTPAKNVFDATALFKPRPDNDPENVTLALYYNWFNTNLTTLDSTQYDKPTNIVGLGSIGGTYIVQLGIDITVTGVAGTGAIGTEIPTGAVIETGVAGTGAIGTEIPTASVSETGVAGTGAIGTEIPTGAVVETGLAGTGAIGTVVIDLSAWGNGTWGAGTWGN
jgi:hypothetical protein